MLDRPIGPWVGYCAAIWALLFGVLHAVWATGCYVGLPEAKARAAFQQPWFLAYDLLVIAICAVAVLVALAMVRPFGLRRPRRTLVFLAWCGSLLLGLRGGGAVIHASYLFSIGRYSPDLMQLYDLWFCLGAALFTFNVLGFSHRWRASKNAA